MRRLLAAVVTLVLAAAPASAQQRLFALVSNVPTPTSAWEAGIENGSVGDPQLVAAAVADTAQLPMFAGGGRFLVWQVSPTRPPGASLVVFDRVTSTLSSISGGGALSDPTTTRLFVRTATDITSISLAGTMVLPNTAELFPVAVGDRGRILYAKSSGALHLHALDASTGAPLGVMPLGPGVRHVVPAPDGHSVWLVTDTTVGTSIVTSLRQLALPSGTETLSVPLATMPFPSFFARIEGLDTRAGRIFVSSSVFNLGLPGPGALATFDTATGAEVGRVLLEGESTSFFDQATSRLLTVSASRSSRPVARCGPALLHLTDAATGQEISRTALGTEACLQVAFAASPAAPVLAPAIVTPAGTVTLSWMRGAEPVTHVTIEAGSAPGLSDLAVLPVTTGTSLTIPGVPPGTYYVRVKAANYIGDSVPSNEIVVQVPQ